MTIENEAADFAEPVVVLVRPQLAENVGTTARAMLNCGLKRLRLVVPREDHLSDKAMAASSGASIVLERAGVFNSTEEALADCHFAVATTARRRDMVKPVLRPDAAAEALRQKVNEGLRGAIIFGPERTGLENDDVALADKIVEIPLNPDYSSLNLAQAVLVMGYEWFKSGVDRPAEELPMRESRPATKHELQVFFEKLEKELDDSGFLRVKEKRPRMVRNIRNMFERAELTDQEVRTLHGMIRDLSTYRKGQQS